MDKKNILIVILVLLVIILLGTSLFLINNLYQTGVFESCNSGFVSFHNMELTSLSLAFDSVGQERNKEAEFTLEKLGDGDSLSSLVTSCPSPYSKYISVLEKFENAKKCGAICGLATDTCFVAIVSLASVPNGHLVKCVNLPKYTEFMDGNVCDPINDYELINPFENLGFGDYILKNIAPTGKTYPQICTYYKSSE